jgi:outer membrane receptor protein involved in Fe transport
VRFPLVTFAALFASALAAQTVVLDPTVVTASRTPQPPEHVPFSLQTFAGAALRATPAVTLDGALRSVPGFSLFRRSDSLTANPTAQGLSLRGLGPSGASRSLIVLDGVPLNDPFGGWVPWTLIPRESLARAELVRGGGATAWGNAALGGVVQLFTQRPEGDAESVAATAGDYSTRSGDFSVTRNVGRGNVQVLGHAFATNGFRLVAPERRGPIDVAAATHHSWLAGRWRQPLGETLELTLSARTFEEVRHNGTPYQRNASRANLGSLMLAGQPTKTFAWTAVGYAQDQGFSSTFSSVNATRTAETPASDQFAVPSTALGAAWTGTWTHADGGRTTAGVDARRVRGETRERFTFVAGNFTRLRVAGGTQEVGGLFALHEQPVGPQLRALIGARVDRWSELDGHRRESDLATGVASRDDHYGDRRDTEFNPSAGLVWTPAKAVRVRLAAQQAFRRPTLNELYRPFRQGANVTEANPALRTEQVTSGEVGVEWTVPGFLTGKLPAGATAAESLTLSAAAFWNDLHDAVGNVTLARGPGTFPLFGTIAAGGVGRQRLNLDRTRVQGLELSARCQLSREFSFTAEYLYDDATVRRAAVAPALVGKRLAQVPRQSGTLAAAWRMPGGLTLTPRVRWIGRQFEDDENTLILGEVVVADVGLSFPLAHRGEVFVNVENAGNARVETGRSGDGVVNVGTPRLIIGGLRLGW